MQELMTAQFWLGLGGIIWVNIILSGDNAVVIALAARSLPQRQQKLAILWGAAAAVVLRIILTVVAVELLKLSFLKLIGGILLFWIAVKLLVPEEETAGHGSSDKGMAAAIKTILLADLVMSLDNVIAVAAGGGRYPAARAWSADQRVPLSGLGATMLMKVMERYPVIITVGAALIGYVAGEMLVTDPTVLEWFKLHAHWMIDFEIFSVFGHKFELSAAGLIGAAVVVAVGTWLAGRKQPSGDA
jgi:YjbE family integral membrane protein